MSTYILTMRSAAEARAVVAALQEYVVTCTTDTDEGRRAQRLYERLNKQLHANGEAWQPFANGDAC